MAGVSRPHHFTVALVKRRWIAPDIIEFSCTRPADFTFVPGQFVRFATKGAERDYTMVSASDAPTLDFCLKLRPNGRFSKTLKEAPLGHYFNVTGPHGYFTYRKSVHPALFVATGTGLAPFVAFSRHRIGKTLLLHGVDSPEALIYQPIVQQAVAAYIPCIAQSNEGEPLKIKNFFRGRVTDYLKTNLPEGVYDFYLCGGGGMIRDATAIIDDRFGDSKLYIENFD